MPNRFTADRTRSKRWRSGTRRNKRYPIAHLVICPEPDVCLVHTYLKRPPPDTGRMRLTLCEQRWVDDVRAGRRHIHNRALSATSRQSAGIRNTRIYTVLRRINTKRFADAGIVNESSPTGRLHPHRPVSQTLHNPGGVVAGMGYATRQAMMAEIQEVQMALYARMRNPHGR